MSEPTYSRYEMLYCDNPRCRVDTFERGSQTRGPCPGCNDAGIVVPRKVVASVRHNVLSHTDDTVVSS